MHYDNQIQPSMPIASVEVFSAENLSIQQPVIASLQLDTRATVTVLPHNCIVSLGQQVGGILEASVDWIDECSREKRTEKGYWVRIKIPGTGFLSDPFKVITDDTSVGKLGRDIINLLKIYLSGPDREWKIID
jgi:hypothetical protein